MWAVTYFPLPSAVSRAGGCVGIVFWGGGAGRGGRSDSDAGRVCPHTSPNRLSRFDQEEFFRFAPIPQGEGGEWTL